MATTSPARTSIAISANPGDETVQTQQNAEIYREAAITSPEVRQGSQGLVSGGLGKVLWSEESSFECHNTPNHHNCRIRAVSSSEVSAVMSGHNDPPCQVPAAIGSLESSDQRRVLPHEYHRQRIFRRDQPDGPGQKGFAGIAATGAVLRIRSIDFNFFSFRNSFPLNQNFQKPYNMLDGNVS